MQRMKICCILTTLLVATCEKSADAPAECIGVDAANELLSIFMDDYHCSIKFFTLHQLETNLSHIGALFRSLGNVGMSINHPKSKAILACRGKGANSIKRRLVKNATRQGAEICLCTGDH